MNNLGLFINYNQNGDLIEWKQGDLQILYYYITVKNKSLLASSRNPFEGSYSYEYSNDSVSFIQINKRYY